MNLVSLAKKDHLLRLTNMNEHGKMNCCGIREIAGLSYFRRKPDEAMLALCSRLLPEPIRTRKQPYEYLLHPNSMRFKYFIFSQAGRRDRYNYGEQFKAYIEKMDFGTVIQTENGHVNPNSGNELVVYLWTINREPLIAWFNAEIGKFNAWVRKAQKDTPVAAPVVNHHPGIVAVNVPANVGRAYANVNVELPVDGPLLRAFQQVIDENPLNAVGAVNYLGGDLRG